MAFHYKSGAAGTPLTSDEISLARVIADAISNASGISIEEVARILSNLTSIELERLLNSITIFQGQAQIQNALLNSVHIGGEQAVSALRSLLPALAIDAFNTSPGEVIPNSLANMNFNAIPQITTKKPILTRMGLHFNKTNPNSLAYASQRAGQLITSIDEFTRQSIRNIITKGFAEQIDVRTIAVQIKNVIGLHPQWADAVVNFQKRETARLLKEGMGEAQARALVARTTANYAERLKNARAMMIARTEVQVANNQGRFEGWKQASDAGYVDPSSTKTWITAPDERTCDVCRPMDGETVAWDDLFSSGAEMPPRHPNCRCQAVMNPPNRGTR